MLLHEQDKVRRLRSLNFASAAGAMKKGNLLLCPRIFLAMLTRATFLKILGRNDIFFQSSRLLFRDSRLSAAEWKYTHAFFDITCRATFSISLRFTQKLIGVRLLLELTSLSCGLMTDGDVFGSTSPSCWPVAILVRKDFQGNK